jgi:hypothetical protein
MGDGAAKLTGGIGGFQQVDRANTVGITDWPGADLITQDVPVLLEGFRADQSVQTELDRLVALSITPDRGEPSSFIVDGPIHFPGRRWVLDGIDFGDEIRRASDGVLTRQFLTLKLRESVDADNVTITGPGGGSAAGGVSFGARIYTVVGDNETLQTIAQKKLGDVKRAKEIGQLNNIRDVRKKLKRGLSLHLPLK